jgi:hypothetical protein
MMPWAADRFADEETIGERPAIMWAFRADSEKLIAAPGEEHGLTIDMPTQHPAIRNRGELHAKAEVGSFELRMVG